MTPDNEPIVISEEAKNTTELIRKGAPDSGKVLLVSGQAKGVGEMKTPEKRAKRIQNSKEPWADLVNLIQQDAYQAGLKDGEIKGLERAVEMANLYLQSMGTKDGMYIASLIVRDIKSEIQKRKDGK